MAMKNQQSTRRLNIEVTDEYFQLLNRIKINTGMYYREILEEALDDYQGKLQQIRKTPYFEHENR